VLCDPACFAVVDCLWSILMMGLAEWNDIEVALFVGAVSVTDDVMRIAGTGPVADNTGQGLDAGNVRPRLWCSPLGLWLFQAERAFAGKVQSQRSRR